jgi:GDP-L-fucose synthase
MELTKDKRIIVTGGYGFLGSYVCDELKGRGYENVQTFRSRDYDLTKREDVKRLFDDNERVNIVIHLAAVLGGVGYLKERPGEVFHGNLVMNTLMLEESRLRCVDKFVGVGSVFSYPRGAFHPLKEENLWKGDVEEVTAPYSLPKRMMLKQSYFYRKQYGMNAIHLLLTSIFGPGMSSSHAIPMMIERFDSAVANGENRVINWGTGNATRDLLYVEDAARAVVDAVEKYDEAAPVNIGSGRETSIRGLAEKIAELTGFKGELIWDDSKPEGPKKVLLDVRRAREKLGFEAGTILDDGLRKTIGWYRKVKK